MRIDLTVEVDDSIVLTDGQEQVEKELVHLAVRDLTPVISAAILRWDGFGHAVPDETTRQEL